MVVINKQYQAAKTNYGSRGGKSPRMIVLHTTETESFESALKELTVGERRVSAHYLIDRDGQIYQLVDESDAAHHAGESSWRLVTGEELKHINSASIGIEFQCKTGQEFTPEQIQAGLALTRDIQQRYGISPHDVVGHADIAPGRKSDPPMNFPWELFRDAGIAANGARRGAATKAADVTRGYAALQRQAQEDPNARQEEDERRRQLARGAEAQDAAENQAKKGGEQRASISGIVGSLAQIGTGFTSGNLQLGLFGLAFLASVSQDYEEQKNQEGSAVQTGIANRLMQNAGNLVEDSFSETPIGRAFSFTKDLV